MDILPILEKEAKERQIKLAGIRLNKPDLPEKFPEPPNEGESREFAAKLTGTNSRYVSDAKLIKEQAPELVEDIRSGEITIQEAKKQLKRQAHM